MFPHGNVRVELHMGRIDQARTRPEPEADVELCTGPKNLKSNVDTKSFVYFFEHIFISTIHVALQNI